MLDVAFVNNQNQHGGAETVMAQLHTGLLAAGHRSTVYVDECDPRVLLPHTQRLCPAWLNRLDRSRLHGIVRRLDARPRWTDRRFRALARSRHEIVHIHNFHGIYATPESLAMLAREKPVVWTFHRFWGITGGCDHPGDCEKYNTACGDCPLVHEWPICGVDNTTAELARKERVLGPAPICVIAPSRHLARRVSESRVGRRWRVEHIPNGVNPDAFRGTRKHDADFRRALGLTPGRVSVLVANRSFQEPLKGFPIIEAALGGLPDIGLQVVLVGEGAERAAAALPAHHVPVACGYVTARERLAEIYEAADVMLYASPRENFPCVVLEAMAAECAVVSTPTDGVLEQVEDGRTGWLAEDFSPVALARTLARAVADGAAGLRDAGRRARARVCTEFSEERMIEAHLRLYREVAR
jgi:glycosyltransferase involved in cell wall biosynthesis